MIPMQPKSVAVLAYNELCTFEFSVAVEVFGLPRPEIGTLYDFKVCSLESGPLIATGGIKISSDFTLQDLAIAETIVIPGWRGLNTVPPDSLLAALHEADERGARILSICSGVFVLAYAGLLDGKRATTHWMYAEALAQKFPLIEVDPTVLYIDEGRVITSAGSAAGLDMCLHIVRLDYGTDIANRVARRLVIAPHREGGQAQFIEKPVSASDERFTGLLTWICENLDQPMNIASLAEKAAMSTRTFERRFRQTTGLSPGQWLRQQRLSKARYLLETGFASVESIALDSGFGSAENLRHHFRVHLGTNPLQYRRTFNTDCDQ